LASTFVKKTEDQLDAYREGIILILDLKDDMLGWTAKAKAALLLFKKDLVQQIGLGLDLPWQRFRIVSVSKASQKKTWKALNRDPTFYLGLPVPPLLLLRGHKRTHGKRRGVGPRAAARHSKYARVHTDFHRKITRRQPELIRTRISPKIRFSLKIFGLRLD